jgi:UDP-3-O-[3-hydroxymyristoyl] N-acetylglucosamine deacetylase / 3-hydroxyacyl-[acyl-carrier-protein] dehydratase
MRRSLYAARSRGASSRIRVGSGARWIHIEPSNTFRISYTLDNDHPAIGTQVLSCTPTEESFVEEYAPARTYGFLKDLGVMRKHGLALGGSLDNAIVIDHYRVLTPEGLRFPDEFVRHKIGDVVGDLALVGARVRAHIIAERPSHAGSLELAKALRARAAAEPPPIVDAQKIMQYLPHRYPMLLVDRVLEIVGDTKATGIKNVTFNDLFFQGHYPGTPIMPGVLIVEAMAQLGGLLLSQKLEHTGKLAVLLSMDKVKMRHPVIPGDQLILEAVTVRVKSRTGHVRCKAFVQDKLAAEADIKFMLVDAEPV